MFETRTENARLKTRMREEGRYCNYKYIHASNILQTVQKLLHKTDTNPSYLSTSIRHLAQKYRFPVSRFNPRLETQTR